MTVDEWADYAAGWDDDAHARAYAEAAYASLVSILEAHGLSPEDATICDFGCGTGLLTEQLAGVAGSIDAVDTSPAMLEKLSSKIRQHGWTNVSIFTELPTPIKPYDLVVCSSVCSFLDDYPGTVKRFADSMQADGLFVQWDWEHDDADPDAHGFTRGEIEEALTAAGLTSVFVDTAFEIPAGEQIMRPLVGVGQKAGAKMVS